MLANHQLQLPRWLNKRRMLRLMYSLEPRLHEERGDPYSNRLEDEAWKAYCYTRIHKRWMMRCYNSMAAEC